MVKTLMNTRPYLILVVFLYLILGAENSKICLGRTTFQVNKKKTSGSKFQLDTPKEKIRLFQKINSSTISKKSESQVEIKVKNPRPEDVALG